MAKKLILIDGHGLAFRGFYALPETLTASDGTPTNAIVGFTNMLLKAMDKWKTDAVGLFFDPKGPTRRNEMYDKYKAGRKPTPDAFKVQLPLIIDISRAMGIPVFIRDGVEADDYIVSTARYASKQGWQVLILSADKDLFQIIDNNISVVRPSKGVSDFDFYDRDFFVKKYGFEPVRMADYLALTGDAVDNIPGVPGIGDKTASELVSKYESIEDIYTHIDDFKGAKRTKLENGMDSALSSRELVIPLDTEPVLLDDMKVVAPDELVLRDLCARLGMRKLLQKFGFDDSGKIEGDPHHSGEQSPQQLNDTVLNVQTMVNDAVKARITIVALGQILSSDEISLAYEQNEEQLVFYVADNNNNVACVNEDELKNSTEWNEWILHGKLTLYGYRRLIAITTVCLPFPEHIRDLEAVHYMLHPDRGSSAIEKTLGMQLPQGADLACKLTSLYEKFAAELKGTEADNLLHKLDVPLSPVLARIQKNGIYVCKDKLIRLSDELNSSIEKTENDIAEKIGERINLNSPKQVGYVLFEQLKLPVIKKNKTGYSTGIEVLDELSRLPEPLCDVPLKMIEYREQSKMLSGFVVPFLKLAEEGDGKIHSTFDQFATGTGRLASYDPNVQNIPQFGSWAEKFRSVFVPSSPDRIFVAADYSQIELRVLAHLSGEQRLIDAFNEDRDVHMETASWVFGLPAEDITKEQRRFAKVVNFGLLYGMTAHGLAQRLGISRPQAASIVERYFRVLPGIKRYMENSILKAKVAGKTESFFGRIRPLSEVSTIEGRGNNPIDRIAVNTPVQSTASDIAKFALLEFDASLAEKYPDAHIVLQVHDSIICECAQSDAEAIRSLLIEKMEHVCKLNVPLKVESKTGMSLNEI
jgi:DNA polymerase-1